MQQEIERRNETRNAEARADGGIVNHKTVMVETQPSADVPPTVTHLVLNIKRRLDVPLAVREIQIQLRAGIELRWVGDVILQGFVDRGEERVGTGFPIVVTTMAGDIAANVPFAIAAILIDHDGSGQRIGAKRKTGITH